MGNLSYHEKKVGVIFGFLKQILKLSYDFKTRDFIFCWDSKQSYRKLICPDYKANRQQYASDEERADSELAFVQFDELREKILPYMGFVNIFHQTGYESDDLIAWIVARFPDDTVIVSSDNDLLQLLVDHRFNPVRRWDFKELIDEAWFTKNWHGLKPFDWIRVKAIAGCKTDNVIGVKGVAEPSAAKYVAGLLPDGVKKKSIDDAKDLIDFNIPLVGLPFNGRKPIRISGIEKDNISEDKFSLTFGQYGFRSLLSGEETKKWTNSFFGGQIGRQ